MTLKSAETQTQCRRTLLLSAFICHRSLSVSMIATKCFPLQKRLVCNVNTRNDYITWNIINPRQTINSSDYGSKRRQVPPRFELGSLDSKSRVLTITPWDHRHRHHRCKVVVLQYRWTTQVVDKMHPLKRNFFLSCTAYETRLKRDCCCPEWYFISSRKPMTYRIHLSTPQMSPLSL